MKPTQIHPKRTIALLAITALLPLAANAGTLHHVESSHIAAPAASVTKIAALADSDTFTARQSRQADLSASMQPHLDEVSHQASLVRDAYLRLSRDIASGDEQAIKHSQARYVTHKAAFLMAQQNLRASLQALRQGDHGGGTRVD